MSISQYNFPTKIRFGAGASKELHTHCKKLGMAKPLLITDQSIGKLPFIATIVDELGQHGLTPTVSARTIGNPVGRHVDESLADYKQHDCDGIVAIGGGAALDVGKAVAIVVNNPGHIFEYDVLKGNHRSVEKPLPPLIAMPTTSGTGSEVGRAAVVSDDESKAKVIIFHPALMPKMVIADPELTVGLPAAVTAATGFDALTHNIEAYLSQGYHPMCDGIALEAVRLISRSLKVAYTDPSNIAARSDMLMASLMGAVAFQKGLGVTHSCAHSLSTVYDLHHGLANALMLEACLKFNAETHGSRLVDLGHAIDLGKKSDLKPEDFITWVSELMESVGIKRGLKNHGVTEIEPLLDGAVNDFCHTENPRPVTRSDFKKLYEASL